MKRPVLTVTRKVAAGYLLIVFFSLVAVVYALGSLRIQTSRSERLVAVDFGALVTARNLRQNLLAHESLERQFLILRDPAFIELLDRRREELEAQWASLAKLPLPEFIARTAPLVAEHRQKNRTCRDLLAAGSWQEAKACIDALAPLRSDLQEELDAVATHRQQALDRSLAEFNLSSARAFQVTLLLTFLGIALSAPAAMAIVLSIHRSVKALTRATQEIAGGSFDHQIPIIERQDEFGLLAREFRAMADKLRELEQLRLDANPLTYLPGNMAIEREMEQRVKTGIPFAHLYIDLDNFKAYNDRYGYRAGSGIIARVGDLVQEIVRRVGNTGDFIGHIGGDDYVVITAPDRAEPIAQAIVEEFGEIVPEFYSEEDRHTGFFIGQDRYGVSRKFPLLTVSIAIVLSHHLENPSAQAISRECVQMKEHLKTLPGSNYLIDRRKIT